MRISSLHVELLLRSCLGTILLAAGGMKLAEPQHVRVQAVAAYGLLPRSWSNAVALLLPLAEITLASLMFIGVLVGIAAWTTATLSMMFALALAINLMKGNEFGCACFGFDPDSAISWAHVALNVLLAGGALALSVVDGRAMLGVNLTDSQLPPLETVSVAVVGVTSVLLAYAFRMALIVHDSRSRFIARINGTETYQANLNHEASEDPGQHGGHHRLGRI